MLRHSLNLGVKLVTALDKELGFEFLALLLSVLDRLSLSILNDRLGFGRFV